MGGYFVIKQAYVQAGDITTPTLQTIRERISTAVDETAGTALERLTRWLQAPTSSEFTDMLDQDCKVRAEAVGDLLSAERGTLFHPSNLSVAFNISKRWESINAALEKGRAVYISGSASHVGGDKSRFKMSFHVIVFLAVGRETDGRVYYLGFDPDVSATTETRDAWKALVAGDPEPKPGDFSATRSLEVVRAMMLGDTAHGFGPLVRKYYVETAEPFPKAVYA
ncbi:hypothetical protein AB0O01_03425 [Streptomyces sp. NPDC093252]|uniref:hypothetical protein n=1 Tax=Streptomyces sp. NPDC093252 TaxID=3154980 RepID=UPI0034165A2B